MAIAANQLTTHTAEDYLVLEIQSDIRNEYRNGEIVPRTGGAPEHNKIATALNAVLWFGLRGKPYSVFVTDQRLWIPAVDLYTYPDVMAIADPVELKPGRKDTVTNPLMIAEVLSDSTASYDRGDKFEAYRTIPTLQEYLLIAQDRYHVEQFVKQSEYQWLFTEYSGVDSKVTLSSMPVTLELRDLYANVLGG
ncbi:MAG: Uma2 family endonuclease [Leptolyngbyaceae cyanobacterium MO_188.B28]|nr:Uma2 family endonuclease [Leptolyngbyaceae cyanobacterium MO_188.B28]